MSDNSDVIATIKKMLSDEALHADRVLHSMPDSFSTQDDFDAFVDTLSTKEGTVDWQISADVVISGLEKTTLMELVFDVDMESLLSTYRDSDRLDMLETFLHDSTYADVREIMTEASRPQTFGILSKAKVVIGEKTDYLYDRRAKGYVEVVVMGDQLHFDFANTLEYLSDYALVLDNQQFISRIGVPLRGIAMSDGYDASFTLTVDEVMIKIDLRIAKVA